MRRALLLLLFTLAGCAGKPTTYLDLTPVAPARLREAAGLPALSVGSVDIPPAIDRRQFTAATGGGTLHVSGKTEWAGPLGPMARIVLAQDLAARLPGAAVLMPGDPLPPGGAAAVHVAVQEFMSDSSGGVTLQADWFVTAPHGAGVLAQGRFSRARSGGKTPAAEAQAMSGLLGELADAITRGVADRVEN